MGKIGKLLGHLRKSYLQLILIQLKDEMVSQKRNEMKFLKHANTFWRFEFGGLGSVSLWR